MSINLEPSPVKFREGDRVRLIAPLSTLKEHLVNAINNPPIYNSGPESDTIPLSPKPYDGIRGFTGKVVIVHEGPHQGYLSIRLDKAAFERGVNGTVNVKTEILESNGNLIPNLDSDSKADWRRKLRP